MADINFFGVTTFRNERKKFGIKLDDRRRHIYIIGKTGMGKTALLKNMAIQDIREGRGVGFIDPHGEAADALLDFIPSERVNDVCYFNPQDIDYPIAFNVMEEVKVEHRHLVASGLMGVFKKLWPDVWSARMEYILNNSILALLEYPNSTLLGINRLLSDAEFRKKVVDKVTDPVIKAFWVQEFARYTQRYEVEATAAIQNKIGQFISAPLIRNIVGQVQSSIDMREVMDSRKILIVNLSKGAIGEDTSRLLGGLLITKLQLAAMSRVDIPEEERKDFHLYVDEFQNFATESFVNILSEARKYRLDLTLANQYITQMEESVRDAVFGNVGTIVSFRVGAEDAEYLEKEFVPQFTAADLVNLPKYNIYLKLMVDGVAGRPFSAQTLPPFPKPAQSYRDQIIKLSREKYSTPREIVEEKIARWAGSYITQESSKKSSTPQLYDAQCQRCGKWIKVPFKPDGRRPVYCKSCLKEIEKEKEESEKLNKGTIRGDIKTVSLENLLHQTPIPFSPKKKEKIPESTEKEKSSAKDISKEKLKKLLEESLGKSDSSRNASDDSSQNSSNNVKRGIIKPGETVKF